MHKVEIIYFAGCPNFRKTCDVICQVLETDNLEFELSIRPVRLDEDLTQGKFYGSPTVLINGQDVEKCFIDTYHLDHLDDVPEGLACRLYECDVSKECPSEPMIRCALNQ